MLPVRKCATAATVIVFASLTFGQTVSIPNEKELAQISARGQMLFEYDEAAWHSSDAVIATNPPKGGLGRYIARKTDMGWIVAFGHLNDTRDAFLISVLASQGKSTQEFSIKKFDPAQRDAGFFLAAAKGIDTVSPDFRGVDRTYNIAVLPAPAGQFYIYFVPGGTDSDPYPLGADVRYLVSSDGGSIVEKRQLHKGIIPRGGAVPAGSAVAGGVHSHVLSNVPEDTDVFHVLSRKPAIPEYIGTEVGVYEVETNGTIHLLRESNKHK
jgi:hypothetical protein